MDKIKRFYPVYAVLAAIYCLALGSAFTPNTHVQSSVFWWVAITLLTTGAGVGLYRIYKDKDGYMF